MERDRTLVVASVSSPQCSAVTGGCGQCRRSEFAANTSHENRTPLNGVTGALKLMSETRLSNRQAELVHMAEISGVLRLLLVNDVLDDSKLGAVGIQLERHAFAPDVLAPVLCGSK